MATQIGRRGGFLLRYSSDLLRAGALAGVLLLMPGGTVAAQSAASAKSSQDLEHRADAARERGDTQLSLQLYERALAVRPDWQEGWWYYGSLLYDQSQYAKAVQAFRKLVKLNGNLGDAWAMLGLSEYECKDYDSSFQDIEKAESTGAELEPPLQNVLDYHLALLLNVRGESDAASMLLSSLYLRGVHSEDLQVALGLSMLRVPLYPTDLDPSRDALVHDAGSVAALIAQKQYDKAEIAFQDMLKHYPDVHFIHYAFGAMLASNGRDREAEEQFKAETIANPASALAYMEWSFIESRSRHYPEAVRLARKAVELSDRSFMAHYLLGNALLMTGDIKGSVPELETARGLAPEVPEIRYSLARAYARLGETALAKQEQNEFVALQRKGAIDRSRLQKRYPSAQPITGIAPITPE